MTMVLNYESVRLEIKDTKLIESRAVYSADGEFLYNETKIVGTVVIREEER